MTKLSETHADGFLVEYDHPDRPKVEVFLTTKGGTLLSADVHTVKTLIEACYVECGVLADLSDLDGDEWPDYVKIVALGYNDEDTLAVAVYERPDAQGH